jgi:hypothetical protein
VYTNSTSVQGTSVLQECWGTVELYRSSIRVQEYYRGTGKVQGYRCTLAQV